MKALTRRLFTKAVVSAPLAASQAAAEEAFKLTEASIGPTGAAVPVGGGGAVKLAGLAKAGLLPEWFLRNLKRDQSWDKTITPDVACLKSVALSVKFLIHRQRREEREQADLMQRLVDQALAEKFWQRKEG
jgi:hypothetical protein